MPYKDVAPFPKQMTIVIGLCVVGLMAFGLALSYYKNILFDRQLQSMQERNEELKGEIGKGYRRLEYLQSAQYKDKFAKETMGVLRRGEKVLIIAKTDAPLPFLKAAELTAEEQEAIYEENLRRIRVIDHWRLFLFHRDKIGDLRKEL